MLYTGYEVVYYIKGNGRMPVREYLYQFATNERAKIRAAIDYLKIYEGRLFEPYTKHVGKKIWELRIKSTNHQHRIFYSITTKRKIVLLSAFSKKTQKTPNREIKKALNYLQDYITKAL